MPLLYSSFYFGEVSSLGVGFGEELVLLDEMSLLRSPYNRLFCASLIGGERCVM